MKARHARHHQKNIHKTLLFNTTFKQNTEKLLNLTGRREDHPEAPGKPLKKRGTIKTMLIKIKNVMHNFRFKIGAGKF